MRWIGYFLLLLLGILILLLFVKIQVEVFIQNQKGWIELRYLWLKYRINFADLISSSMMQEMEQQAQEVKEVTEKKVTKTEIEVDRKFETKITQVKEVPLRETKTKKVKVRRQKKVKDIKVKKKLDFKEIKMMIHRGKVILKEGKTILIRLTTRIKVRKLESDIEFSLDDAMTTGCLLGFAWSVQANIYRFIERYVKKIEHYRFDVKSKFSGNSIFLNLSCILSFRIVDIIIVLILSLEELLTIKKMLKLEEE